MDFTFEAEDPDTENENVEFKKLFLKQTFDESNQLVSQQWNETYEFKEDFIIDNSLITIFSAEPAAKPNKYIFNTPNIENRNDICVPEVGGDYDHKITIKIPGQTFKASIYFWQLHAVNLVFDLKYEIILSKVCMNIN